MNAQPFTQPLPDGAMLNLTMKLRSDFERTDAFRELALAATIASIAQRFNRVR